MKLSKALLGTALFSALAILFLYMAGFFSEKLPQEIRPLSNNKANIQSVIISNKTVLNQRQFTGNIVAEQKAVLSARLTAKVAQVLVDLGSQVEQGDILIRLENSDLDARVQQSEQAASSAQAQLNVARNEYQRAQVLLEKKLISQSQFEQAESQLKTSDANFKQAKAAVQEAQSGYGFSIISAPFAGIIDSLPINMGDTASPGMQLLSLYNPKSLQIEANISESLIHKTRLNSTLHYEIPAFNIKDSGQVVELSPAADNTSRSFLVKISITEANLVFPGSYARVWVETGETELLVVPEQAVYQVGQLDYVKVLENGEIKTKLIQLGENNRVRKGLNSGDQVILNPLNL